MTIPRCSLKRGETRPVALPDARVASRVAVLFLGDCSHLVDPNRIRPKTVMTIRLVTLACIAAATAITWTPLARAQLGVPTGNLCAALSNCNAHGRCDALTKTCECNEGYGASTDITNYRSPDCSLRVWSLNASPGIALMLAGILTRKCCLAGAAGTCPAGPSWGGIPTSATTSHAKAECSDAGVCDRSTGTCMCYYGYEGSACQRSTLAGCCRKCAIGK